MSSHMHESHDYGKNTDEVHNPSFRHEIEEINILTLEYTCTSMFPPEACHSHKAHQQRTCLFVNNIYYLSKTYKHFLSTQGMSISSIPLHPELNLFHHYFILFH